MYGFYNKLSTEVYDLDKPIGHSFGDIEYYSNRLKGVEGRILEPAVGTGRVMIPLIESGYQVDGMDLSADMLELCKDHCEARGIPTRLFQGSMHTMSIDEQYEAIILPAGSFLLIKNREQAMQALSNFYKHIESGGKLIIDTFLTTDFEQGRIDTSEWMTLDGDVITLDRKLVEVDFVNQFTVAHHKYEKWHRQQFVEAELERFPLKWYGVEEFKLMLKEVGFEDIVISTDYQYNVEPTNSEQTMTYEAYKK
ncbi:class I SAM-dependent methyltransferase [Alkalibacillus haloalkaliphilus]|uniref:class I SAM-dependent methyltransferase n=1 Tax=Alkalibacillus haloalkaliphilus TaxID=94136 RepID=UPI002935A49E|nr:class I SAM-dependent methyltransferase [Alkalibacillus haloalkaliphilus]MDV2581993.1 class I SAM-dependent methyltransferase [Alkalibacillus haloalkaliphilus]